jgi:RNA polymerase sigma factor (sigma-70 family)
MSSVETDSILIEKAKKSDYAALSLILMRYERELMDYIKTDIPNYILSQTSADDIRQIVWEETCKAIVRFEDRGDRSFISWLKSIAHLRIIDAVRAYDSARRFFSDSDDSAEGFREPADPSSTPSRKIARREGIARMRQAMSSLRESHRKVLELRYIQSFSLSEVAKQMKRSHGSVAMLTRRALEHLHAEMGDSGDYLTKQG